MFIEAMLRNNKFENFLKTVKYRYGSIITDHSVATFLKYWNRAAVCFHKDERGSIATLRLTI
jgi:hypothetical protein